MASGAEEELTSIESFGSVIFHTCQIDVLDVRCLQHVATYPVVSFQVHGRVADVEPLDGTWLSEKPLLRRLSGRQGLLASERGSFHLSLNRVQFTTDWESVSLVIFLF